MVLYSAGEATPETFGPSEKTIRVRARLDCRPEALGKVTWCEFEDKRQSRTSLRHASVHNCSAAGLEAPEIAYCLQFQIFRCGNRSTRSRRLDKIYWLRLDRIGFIGPGRVPGALPLLIMSLGMYKIL